MPVSTFWDLNQLQQGVARLGKELQHLRGINQRVSQQMKDLDRQTELRPEVIEQRKSEARQRATAEAEAYVKSELISARLEAIAAQASHYTPAGFLARGFVNSPPEPGTFDGTGTLKLQTAMLSELQEMKWALVLPGLPTSGLSDLLDVMIQSENFALQSRLYAEVTRRIEAGGASESQRAALTLMNHKLEREDNQPAAVQEAKALIAEAERLAIRIEQTLFAVRSGEPDTGAKVDMIGEERRQRAFEAAEHTNPATVEKGA